MSLIFSRTCELAFQATVELPITVQFTILGEKSETKFINYLKIQHSFN